MDLIRFEKTALLYRNLKDFELEIRSLSCDCDLTKNDMILGFALHERKFDSANFIFLEKNYPI